jgi:hypothetical protein
MQLGGAALAAAAVAGPVDVRALFPPEPCPIRLNGSHIWLHW